MSKEQLTLGQLIDKLKACDQAKWVIINSSLNYPGYLSSYRGYYEQLAVTIQSKNLVKVAEFLKLCKKACGYVFTGYKGGEYLMDTDTPVWASNYGHASRAAIVDVIEHEDAIVLETKYMP